jgi:hypothetical protein
VKEQRFLHIISFNVPYPPDYGGVIEVYYKIKALHDAGIKIILHNFHYGRLSSEKLNELCSEVFYYPRETSAKYFFRKLPYILATRDSKGLLHRLQKDNYPILFEGIHTTSNIADLMHNNRKLIIRAHNIEHSYYLQLSKNENFFWNKLYFYIESIKLSNYEKKIYPFSLVAAISPNDDSYFSQKYNNSRLINAFHPYDDVNIQPGLGSHILYHGNLSVAENYQAAEFLIKKIFPSIPYPCIIAGKQPSKSLFKLAESLSNVKILANPNQSLMEELISNAQINLLPAYQESGVKLKLLAALFNGRHCLINLKMSSNSELGSFCQVASSNEDMIRKATELFVQPFNSEEIEKRKAFLNLHYNNRRNAQRLIDILWPE